MSRELSRRLARVEADRKFRKAKPYQHMSDAELIEEIRQHTRGLEAEHGPTWRDWLSEHEPECAKVYRELEREGIAL